MHKNVIGSSERSLSWGFIIAIYDDDCLTEVEDELCGKKERRGTNQKLMTEEILAVMEERRLAKNDTTRHKALSKIINEKCRKAKQQYYDEK